MNKKGINIFKVHEMYKSGISVKKIAEEFHCSKSNIYRRLNKLDVYPNRTNIDLPERNFCQYHVNVNFFDDIDSELKAYILGIMCSDGSVCKNRIYLKMNDYDVIEIFKNALEYDGPIKYISHNQINKNWNDSYKVEINSKQIVLSLKKLGCTENKTHILQLPKIKKELYRHFIRGYFDGDGCLQLQDKIYHCRFDIVSASKDFLEQIRPIISCHSKTNGYLGKEKQYNVWHLNYSGHQVLDILDWLYKDSHYYMKRKFFKYQILSSCKTG